MAHGCLLPSRMRWPQKCGQEAREFQFLWHARGEQGWWWSLGEGLQYELNIQWCGGIDIEREAMEVPVPGSSLNPACELFGFGESDDKNKAAGSQAPFSSTPPWNCLCGFCLLRCCQTSWNRDFDSKKWGTSLAGIFLMEAEVCLCSWCFFGCLFLQVFKFYCNLWMFRCLSFRLRRESCACLHPTDQPLKPFQVFWKPECHSHLWGRGELAIPVQVWFVPTGTWKANTKKAENRTAVMKNFPLVEVLLANDGDEKGLPVKSFPCLINSCVILPLILKYEKAKLWDSIWKLVLFGVQLDIERFLFSSLTNLKQM